MKSPVALTPQELRNLLMVTREQDHRAYVVFLLTVCHGLRVTEATSLRRKDFTLNGSTFTRMICSMSTASSRNI